MKTKKFLAIFLVLAILAGMMPTVFAEDNPHSEHSSYITHIEAVEGNCTKPGNIEFWYCSFYTCDKCYSDEAMTQEISPADTVITPGVHSDACVGCEYAKYEKTFDKFVPSEHPMYDEQEFSNYGLYSLGSYLNGSTVIFVAEHNGVLYAMGNETNADGSRSAIDLSDYVAQDGSVSIDSDTVEFFTYRQLPNTYRFLVDNGYMSVFDEKIVVHGENLLDIDTSYDVFPQTIRFEQNTELSDYAADKGYLYGWALNSPLILFDGSGAEPKFAPKLMWPVDENGDYLEDENGVSIDNRAHNVMMYVAPCDHPNMEHTDAVPATCTEDGNVEYWYCENCNKNFGDADGNTELAKIVIYATDHDWGDWTVVSPATETEDGLKQRVCKKDSTHVEEESFHLTTYVPAVPASCTECGVVEHWFCDDCYMYYRSSDESGELYEDQLTAPATGHKFDKDGICENCTMKRNVYKQISTLAQFDQLSEDAYYLIVFKDGDKTYAAQLPKENPYWVDRDHDGNFDLFTVDENENSVPDCIEETDADDNGNLDYLEDQDFDEIIGTDNDYFRIYEGLAYAQDEELSAASNFVEVTVATDGSITLADEGAMEFQMMEAGVWGGSPFTEEDFAYDVEINGINTETERIRAAWVPNYWVANSGMLGYYDEGHLMMQNRRFGDKEFPGVLDNKNWKISFNADGTALLVCTWESYDDTGALQLVKYTNSDGEDDMTVVGLPEFLWDDSSIMPNRTATLPAYLYASEPVYDHTCDFGDWSDDENGRTHTRTCKDESCGKTETREHGWDEGVQNGTPTCTEGAEITYTCLDCGATKTGEIGSLGHDFGGWISTGSAEHKKVCSRCPEETFASHVWGDGEITKAATTTETGTRKYTCADCDAAKTEIIPKIVCEHSWGKWTAENDETHKHICENGNGCEAFQRQEHCWDEGSVTTPSTETSEGVMTYTCLDCGHEKTESIAMLEHTHSYGPWASDDEYTHSRACVSGESCTTTETEAHSCDIWSDKGDRTHVGRCSVCDAEMSEPHVWSDWTVGVNESQYIRSCICGAVEEMTVNAAIGDVVVNNTSSEENGANADLVVEDPLDLFNSVLTDEEQSAVSEGATVSVYLEVQDIPADDVSASAAAAAAAEIEDGDNDLNENTELGMYLDINLFKEVTTTDSGTSNTEATQITETSNKVTITIRIPEELISTNSQVNRVYRIIRVHEDENGNLITDVIEGVFDPENKTFTFETDKFSTYALVYNDDEAKAGDANGDGEINAVDAVLIAQYLAGWTVEINLKAFDCNGDGEVNAVDSVLLAQYLAGWDVKLGPTPGKGDIEIPGDDLLEE